jgi:uracil-DNA glycosylase family 4
MELCYGCWSIEMRLIQIYDAYQRDSAFGGLRSFSNPFVPGNGSLEPKAILIGEAPGRNEARLLMPFVGAAGQLLEELLGSVQLDRDDVFITNLVKYRPVAGEPEAFVNRPPSDSEKIASLPYLRDEVLALGCKLLVPMGAHALSAVLPGHSISEVHGRVYRKAGGWCVLPLFHPAAALYNPQLKETLFEDIKRLREAINDKGKLRPQRGVPARRG